MKIKILNTKKVEQGSVTLPKQFDEPIRADLIKRSVLAIQANARQPYGASAEAGLNYSARVSKRRRDYRGSYGQGISRVPRKVMNRRGTRMFWVGAEAPGTVGGRRAHAANPEKNWSQKINKVENRKAIRSAMAASLQKDFVTMRGHFIPESYPFAIASDLEAVKTTKELKAILVSLGFEKELARGALRSIRAGIGKLRGRKYQTKKSLLLVVANPQAPVVHAGSNLGGVDVVPVHALNTNILAPGTHYGRATLYTVAALEKLEKEGLFLKNYKAPKIEVKA